MNKWLLYVRLKTYQPIVRQHHGEPWMTRNAVLIDATRLISASINHRHVYSRTSVLLLQTNGKTGSRYQPPHSSLLCHLVGFHLTPQTMIAARNRKRAAPPDTSKQCPPHGRQTKTRRQHSREMWFLTGNGKGNPKLSAVCSIMWQMLIFNTEVWWAVLYLNMK